MKFTALKTLALAMTLTSIVLLAACDTTSTQRVEQLQSAVDHYTEQSRLAEADLESLRSTLQELRALRVQAKDTQDEEALADVLEAVVYVQDRIEIASNLKKEADKTAKAISVQIKKVLEKGDVSLPEELELYAGTVSTTSAALPPPWNFIGYGLAGILTLAVEVTRRRKNKHANATKEIIDGTAELVDNISMVNSPAEAKAVLKKTQTSPTRNLVNDLLAKKSNKDAGN